MNTLLKRVNWRRLLHVSLWMVTVVGIGFLMSFINVKSSEYACNDVKIIIPGDQSFVVRTDIDRVLTNTQGDLIGKTLTAIPIHQIEKDLAGIPFVKKAIVNKDINGTVTIEIKQREAVLRVINQVGNDFYLDREGVKIPLSEHYAPRVLVANGWIEEGHSKSLDSIQSPLMKELFKLSSYLHADSLWSEQIDQLYVNQDGNIEMIPSVGSHKIIIGSEADSLENKFAKLLLFYQKVVPSVGWDAYKSVDLSFANQLVCVRKEKK